jgi:MoaA/NifB/PqqE/SkfB family radical SAM enzyme
MFTSRNGKDSLALVPPECAYNAVLEFNTASCNLRCVYCPIITDKKDFPDYPRQYMTDEIIEHIKILFTRKKPESINIGGNGEATIVKNWMAICEPFFSFGNVEIISNLAKELSIEEASFLARFRKIITSIDTTDEALLKDIRKPLQLRTISNNLKLMRSVEISSGHPLPVISVNCTVTTKTYPKLAQLISLAAALGVNEVCLQDMFETGTAVSQGLRSLSSLDTKSLDDAANEIEQACTLAAKTHIKISISPRLKLLFRIDKVAKTDRALAAVSTVCCFQPWDGFWINANGHISYCCRHVGATDEDIRTFSSVDEIINHRNAIELREALLSGDCPQRCRSCELGLPTTRADFQRLIRISRLSKRLRHNRLVVFAKKIPLLRIIWNKIKVHI